MTRSRLRWTVVAAGLLLILLMRAAPSLPATGVVPLSVVWYALLGYLLFTAYTILATRMKRGAAATVVGVATLAPVLLTAIPWAPSLAIHLPCHRNWTWLPTWMLRSSPMGSTLLTVDGTRVKVCYGRPAARGRTMLGGGNVPFGHLWRTGANEPTTIIAPIPISVAGLPMPAGRASLYTVPGPETWELILNASTSQWGIESEYSDAVRAQEIGRTIIPSQSNGEHVDRLTIEPDPEGLVLQWERTKVRIPVRR